MGFNSEQFESHREARQPKITIQNVKYDNQYIEELIDDMLSAEDRPDTETNRLDALNCLHNTTYLADIEEDKK
ncbi:MAG: hypothetical protein KAS32_13450 [Candidatus Peribacteraceae bacterium]|nr:hypothetical protein [Candidatus Peribacteraceae bacterium]